MTELTSDSQEPSSENALLQLDKLEARVLGALMEKQYTTPEAYPLTQNALTSACNQKSSREPVMKLSPGEVGHTLRQLENRALVQADHGSRSERFTQQLSHQLALNNKRQAVICLLLLRGPQTLSELLTRSARLANFSDAEDLHLSVLKLIERPLPLVQQLPRQNGQREVRYAHLLCGEPEQHTAPDTDKTISPQPASHSTVRMIELEQRVAELELAMAEIQQQLGISANDTAD